MNDDTTAQSTDGGHAQPGETPRAPDPPPEATDATGSDEAADADSSDADSSDADGSTSSSRRRRRGNRGGQRRRKGSAGAANGSTAGSAADPSGNGDASTTEAPPSETDIELPKRISEGRPSAEAGDRATVRKPQIGDTLPARPAEPAGGERSSTSSRSTSTSKAGPSGSKAGGSSSTRKRGRTRGGRSSSAARQVPRESVVAAPDAELRRGKERKGKPVGRYLMCVQVRPGMAQAAVLEGRNLVEHYVSRPADDVSQIHGNIYVGRVQNVLPGMEAAFVDIATPKNAVLYRGDVQFDAEDIEERSDGRRIEDILRPRQLIVCQVTKNPIGAKGARLTQEVSLPGRFVVLIPNSRTFGISKRLPDETRKRLREILDRLKPEQHGLIVRTAAEHATEDELRADIQLLLAQWDQIASQAARAKQPTLLHREPELAVRRIREEFNSDYRGVMIDDLALYQEVRDYVGAFNPELADRVEHYDADAEGLSLFERQHVHEQVHKALDRKVWLPSGGSLIVEHTEALTVIDVNTGKNVGRSSLEETVFHNNMEAAEEVAKQLRLRDIGGIIVIDFIDMERKDNRQAVIETFRSALARDKTRTQVFDISELGIVEMTRKRIGEGLLTEFSDICPECDGRGLKVDTSLLD